MTALNQAMPAASAPPSAATSPAPAMLRHTDTAPDDQAAFERLMDRDASADAASADAPGDRPCRSKDRAARDADRRVDGHARRGDTSHDSADDATDDAARGPALLAWALPHPLCGMAKCQLP